MNIFFSRTAVKLTFLSVMLLVTSLLYCRESSLKITITDPGTFKKGCTVFLGDSNVMMTSWQEYFGESVCNLGLGGATTDYVMMKRDMVKDLAPSRIVILVGGNDLLRLRSVPEVAAKYRAIIARYRNISNNIFFVSNLPIRKKLFIKNWMIIWLNIELEKICKETGVRFVNVYHLLYRDGQLDRNFAFDEIHINRDGQKIVADELGKHFNASK
ncbi:MAG: GDSL-type esterase/lipase family protein [Spirochaetes bacterium]|nr:GDSL-type esterase/lipase family protein [Spirochaetota bacterium]